MPRNASIWLEIIIFATDMKINSFKILFVVLLASLGVLASCDDEETYAEQKKQETNAINSFLKKGACVKDLDGNDTILYVAPIKVINEATFYAQDSTTNVAENEYVLLSSTGIYMQIVDKGTGKKLESGEKTSILNRYIEYNINGDSVMSRNNNLYYIAVPDMMSVSNSYGVFTGSFISGVMKTIHSTSAVPEGWLVPLNFITLARRATDTDNLAKVRIIVPHTSGSTAAQSGVYACFYEITYQRGRD